MSVVHIVEEALSRPHTCAQCGESRGPFLDTAVDLIEGRLYLCMMCLRLDAAEVGFAPGQRMDDLVDAKATVEHVEHEVDARNRQIRELKQTLAGRDKSMVEMQVLIEQLEGEIKRKDHLTRLAADHVLSAIAPPGAQAEPVVSALGIATATSPSYMETTYSPLQRYAGTPDGPYGPFNSGDDDGNQETSGEEEDGGGPDPED